VVSVCKSVATMNRACRTDATVPNTTLILRNASFLYRSLPYIQEYFNATVLTRTQVL